MRVVIVSGGFDPLHSGHLSLLKEARAIAGGMGLVIVGLNSNQWLVRKKGAYFLPFCERAVILRAIRYVDLVWSFDDADGSAQNLLKIVHESYPQELLIFANGGDRTDENIPELDVANSLGIKCVFGIGGFDKMNSSSDLLKKWNEKCISQ